MSFLTSNSNLFFLIIVIVFIGMHLFMHGHGGHEHGGHNQPGASRPGDGEPEPEKMDGQKRHAGCH